MNGEINFFAQTSFRNQQRKFGIKLDDRRRHFYVVGKTGMGKTVLLKNMAIQDILAGHGVGFLDPHGEAAEELLNFVPSNRVNDVIYFNPSDLAYPIAFNIMERVRIEHRHLVAAGLMGVFKKIWPDVWSARMEYILNNCILALLEYPGSTLLGVNRMLADPEYRKKVVERITDPVVKAFWVQEYARYTQRYEVEATAAIQNKVGQFISAPLIRNIIGQVKSKIDMREVMDGQKILIMNLSKGKIGEENSRLLGALMITKLQLAAMSRVDTPEEQRKDFFLYIDEFQNFATESFVNILSEARKYRLALILGHQYIAQMDEKVRDAVFGNVGTIVCFRVGAEDAEFLEKEFAPEFTAQDLVNLTKYHIYLKLMIDGVAGRPFSAITLPPFPPQEKSYADTIIRISRERYGTPRERVEEKIARWAKVGELPVPPQSSPQQQQTLYDAMCSRCGKPTKVVFLPDGVRPVYCKSCRKKLEQEKAKTRIEGSRGEEAPQREGTIQGDSIGYESNVLPSRISLKELSEREPLPFAIPRKTQQEEKPKRKGPNLEELRKILPKSALPNNESTFSEAQGFQSAQQQVPQKAKQEGILRPGDTVQF
jgi:CxxC-x17-CxxC domain-containing protein